MCFVRNDHFDLRGLDLIQPCFMCVLCCVMCFCVFDVVLCVFHFLCVLLDTSKILCLGVFDALHLFVYPLL